MKVDLTFENDFCDLSKSDVLLSDAVETIKAIADEKEERSNILIKYKTAKNNDGLVSVVRVNKKDMSEIIKNYTHDGDETEDKQFVLIENDLASGEYKAADITKHRNPDSGVVTYEIICK